MIASISTIFALFLFTSCGKLDELTGKDEELKKAKDKKKEVIKDYPCSKHDIAGRYTDGRETVYINNDCKVNLITCQQEGSISNLTENTLTLTLPVSAVDSSCLSGTHNCSYGFSGDKSKITLTCGANVYIYTKQ